METISTHAGTPAHYGVASPPVSFRHGMTLKEIEKTVIMETLRKQNYNRTRTARVLGIGIRTLQRKLKQYHEDDLNIALDLVDAGRN